MELLLKAGVEAVEIFGDSKMVISHLTKEYRCERWPNLGTLISIGYQVYKIQRPMILHRWLRDTRLWQTEPIFRYTCWNKETGEPISSIT
jgi:ribonuclease HI